MASAEAEKELTLIDHLIELRDRILKCVIAIVLLFLGLFYWANDIYAYVALPLIQALPEGSSMIAIDPTSPFFAPFKLTFYVSFLLAAPYVLYSYGPSSRQVCIKMKKRWQFLYLFPVLFCFIQE